MNTLNEAAFNRAPRRQAFDINIDSANRDKALYPNSNDYRVKIAGAPYKNVRSADILQMRVPQPEGLVPHMSLPTYVRDSHKGEHTSHTRNHAHAQDEGSDTFAYQEAFYIGPSNDLFKFTDGIGHPYSVRLPHTLTKVDAFRVEDGLLIVRTCGPARLLVHCSVELISAFASRGEGVLNQEYVVVEVCDEHTVVLQPVECVTLDPELCGKSGYLFLAPSANAHELAQYLVGLFKLKYPHVEFDILYDAKEGVYSLYKPSGLERRGCLLGNGEDVIECKIPAGAHQLEEVAMLLQRMLNPPEIHKDNDKLVFALRFGAELTVQLEHGFYKPETLIAHIAERMSELSGATFYGVYSSEHGQFTLFSGEYDERTRACDGPLFSLYFQKCVGLAYTLGFPPVLLSDRNHYSSKECVHYRGSKAAYQAGCGYSSTNVYAVALDPIRSDFTISRAGTLEATMQSVRALTETSAVIKFSGPHAFSCNDVVAVHAPNNSCPFDAGLYVVEKCLAWDEIALAMHVRGELGKSYACDAVVEAAPKPFTLPMHLAQCGIAQILGFERFDHIDADCVYVSDSKCLPTGELYLLLDSPELLETDVNQNRRLFHQFARGEPYRTFVGRLDRYITSTAFEFTQSGVPQIDKFVGKTVTLDEITIRLFRSDGKLYDTQGCDHSLVLRVVTEDS